MEQGLVKLDATLFSEKKHYTSAVLSSEFLCVTLKKTKFTNTGDDNQRTIPSAQIRPEWDEGEEVTTSSQEITQISSQNQYTNTA